MASKLLIAPNASEMTKAVMAELATFQPVGQLIPFGQQLAQFVTANGGAITDYKVHAGRNPKLLISELDAVPTSAMLSAPAFLHGQYFAASIIGTPAGGGGGGGDVAAADITDATATGRAVLTAATAAAARTALGAGTSSLALGTTGATAAAGNHTHAAATAGALGFVRQGDAVANAADAPGAVTQLNALLAALRTAGVIAAA